MAAAGKSESGAAAPADLTVSASLPLEETVVRVDAEEFARQEQREIVERAWREQEEYSRAVAELKEKTARREARRAPAIAAAILLAAAALGAVLYNFHGAGDRKAEGTASSAGVQSRAPGEESRPKPELESAAPVDLAAIARAEEEVKKATDDMARAITLNREAEAKKQADLEAKLQAEERARAEWAMSAKATPQAARQPGTVFRDCLDCPRMVVIPAGEFTMGSPVSEAERGGDEGPQHQVLIAYPFALGRTEVTIAEFRRFAEESGYKTEAERDTLALGCSGFIYLNPAAKDSEPQPVTSWRNPGLVQEDTHPALCVSWNDARAYAQWLSRKTGQRYRLPTEAEWEYAARGGTVASRYWGDDPGQACRFANVADQSRFQSLSFGQKHECNDGHYFTAPVGGYAGNGFGLYDMLGNAWEWTEDCWNASYAGAPSDGSAWLTGDCSQRVFRGGSWSTVPRIARSASRNKNSADHRDNLTGFRLVRTLE
jgi:formylglycine-generating enzyme required for sulfatase activity